MELQKRCLVECPTCSHPDNESEWGAGAFNLQKVKLKLKQIKVIHMPCALYFKYSETFQELCVKSSPRKIFLSALVTIHFHVMEMSSMDIVHK